MPRFRIAEGITRGILEYSMALDLIPEPVAVLLKPQLRITIFPRHRIGTKVVKGLHRDFKAGQFNDCSLGHPSGEVRKGLKSGNAGMRDNA
jgi:hypothetical protein